MSNLARTYHTNVGAPARKALLVSVLVAVFGLGACTVEDAENDAQADQQPVEVVPAAIATSYEDAESQANP